MLTLSTTSFGEVTRCLKLFEFHQRDHLIPLPADLPPRMRKGVWLHRALQFEGQGRDWQDALQECCDWASNHGIDQEQAEDLHSECRRILDTYFGYWKTQPRWTWDVISSEEPIEVDLSPSLRLRATVDKIVHWRGRLWLVEHKTTSEIPSATWRAIDPQTCLQYAVATLSGKYQIEGIVFDYLLTREPPVPRVKQNALFYAGTEKMTTTSAAFEQAAKTVREWWNYDDRTADDYLDEMRAMIVNDGAFFRRFEVYRPMAAVAETLRDVRDSAEMIALSERLGHWRRLNNQGYCPKFCLYSSLCAAEYVSGERSSLRDTEFMIENENDREGRDAIQNDYSAQLAP